MRNILENKRGWEKLVLVGVMFALLVVLSIAFLSFWPKFSDSLGQDSSQSTATPASTTASTDGSSLGDADYGREGIAATPEYFSEGDEIPYDSNEFNGVESEKVSGTKFWDILKQKTSNSWVYVSDSTGNIWTKVKQGLGFDQAFITRGELSDRFFSFQGLITILISIILIVISLVAGAYYKGDSLTGWKRVLFIAFVLILDFIFLLAFVAEEGSFMYNMSVGFLAGLFIALFDIGAFFITEDKDSRAEKIAIFLYEKLIITLIVLPLAYATLLWVPILSTFVKTITFYYFLPLALKSVVIAVVVGVLPRYYQIKKEEEARQKKLSGMQNAVLGFATASNVGKHLSQ